VKEEERRFTRIAIAVKRVVVSQAPAEYTAGVTTTRDNFILSGF
jgi:hypothetical protein